MAEVTANEKLQLTLLDLLAEPKSIWELLHDEKLFHIDPELVGQTLRVLYKQLRLKVYRQTLDGLFAAVKPANDKLQMQLQRGAETDLEHTYWVQKETEM